MPFNYNATNVKPSTFGPVPKGQYQLKIVNAKEKTSRNGDPQVVVDFEIAEGDYAGKKIRFYNVTFIPPDKPGAGMSIHFLKTIDQPFEGNFIVDPTQWIDRICVGYVDIENDWNVVKSVRKIGFNADGTPSEEEVPF